jgi:hypothetical protein
MSLGLGTELDFIEELRLRRWARQNYVPQSQRSADWHPVIHDEMTRKDGELATESDVAYVSRA